MHSSSSACGINCMLCYSCPVYAWTQASRSGGVALGAAVTWTRATKGADRRDVWPADGAGVRPGGRMFDGCPKGVDPAGAINAKLTAATRLHAVAKEADERLSPAGERCWWGRRSYLRFMLREISYLRGLVLFYLVFLVLPLARKRNSTSGFGLQRQSGCHGRTSSR